MFPPAGSSKLDETPADFVTWGAIIFRFVAGEFPCWCVWAWILGRGGPPSCTGRSCPVTGRAGGEATEAGRFADTLAHFARLRACINSPRYHVIPLVGLKEIYPALDVQDEPLSPPQYASALHRPPSWLVLSAGNPPWHFDYLTRHPHRLYLTVHGRCCSIVLLTGPIRAHGGHASNPSFSSELLRRSSDVPVRLTTSPAPSAVSSSPLDWPAIVVPRIWKL